MRAISRRDFLSCAGHIAAVAAIAPADVRAFWAQEPRGRIVAREPFGYLEQIAEGIWALVSTPLDGARTTLCNGGLIAGRSGVLAIEGFYEPAGARWLAARSRELTGRWPTHVVVTHFHADHTNGVAGYVSGADRPVLRSTATTRDLTVQKNQEVQPSQRPALQNADVLSGASPSTLDLGGRSVTLVPREGHTPSDVTVEVADPSIVFCGDLVWNGMFPNYVDAVPGALARSVADLRRAKDTIYVPGHGAVGGAPELEDYAAVLREVEHAARRAHREGLTAADAAAKFALPESLGTWALFNRTFFERAFSAWYRELG